jgi:ACS family glucarate transporter-like MFS transporter
MNAASTRSQTQQPPTSIAAPTHVRWKIVLMLTAISALTYIDRLNLQVAGKYIQDEYGFNTETMGWVLGAFSLGYSLFHVPGGWLGDRFGPRRVLALTVLWSSVFTALTAAAPSLAASGFLSVAWSFAVVRFLMGSGEAAANPVGNKTIAYWLGRKERAFGTAVFLAGVGVGGTIAPPAINWITKNWGWRVAFIACGVLGVAVSAAWYAYVRNRPEEHPGVNAEELALIIDPTEKEANAARAKNHRITLEDWGKILRSPSVRGLMFCHFCLVYAVGIFYNWFFIYLVRVRGLAATKASWWTSAPFLATIFMVPLWGFLADRAAVRFGKRTARKGTVWLGIGLSAIFLVSGSQTADNNLAALQLAAAAGFNLGASAILWTTCTDITRSFAGSVSGSMVTFGSLGGWVSPVVTAKIATGYGWPYALDFAALVMTLGGLAWVFINADERVE